MFCHPTYFSYMGGSQHADEVQVLHLHGCFKY